MTWSDSYRDAITREGHHRVAKALRGRGRDRVPSCRSSSPSADDETRSSSQGQWRPAIAGDVASRLPWHEALVRHDRRRDHGARPVGIATGGACDARTTQSFCSVCSREIEPWLASSTRARELPTADGGTASYISHDHLRGGVLCAFSRGRGSSYAASCAHRTVRRAQLPWAAGVSRRASLPQSDRRHGESGPSSRATSPSGSPLRLSTVDRSSPATTSRDDRDALCRRFCSLPSSVIVAAAVAHRGAGIACLRHGARSLASRVTWTPRRSSFSILAAIATFAIAAGAIGREAHRLDAVAPRAVYQLDEAVDFVADRLPPESQARLTPAEVEQLLVIHLRWLHAKGLQPDRAVDAAAVDRRAGRGQRGHARRLHARRGRTGGHRPARRRRRRQGVGGAPAVPRRDRRRRPAGGLDDVL